MPIVKYDFLVKFIASIWDMSSPKLVEDIVQSADLADIALALTQNIRRFASLAVFPAGIVAYAANDQALHDTALPI